MLRLLLLWPSSHLFRLPTQNMTKKDQFRYAMDNLMFSNCNLFFLFLVYNFCRGREEERLQLAVTVIQRTYRASVCVHTMRCGTEYIYRFFGRKFHMLHGVHGAGSTDSLTRDNRISQRVIWFFVWICTVVLMHHIEMARISFECMWWPRPVCLDIHALTHITGHTSQPQSYSAHADARNSAKRITHRNIFMTTRCSSLIAYLHSTHVR